MRDRGREIDRDRGRERKKEKESERKRETSVHTLAKVRRGHWISWSKCNK